MVGKPPKNLKDRVKLSQLRALVAVAKTGSFSTAAHQLDVSQSTVSHSLAALESALGVMLIHRSPQGATLTPVGDRIFAQAKQTLSLIDEIGEEATRAKGLDGGVVRIAAYRSMASELLPEAIARFRRNHPTIQLTIIECDSSPDLADTLQTGQADLAVATLLPDDQFESCFVMEDPIIALLPPGFIPQDAQTAVSPSAPTPTLTWQDLRTGPLITSSSECCKEVLPQLAKATPAVDIDYFISNDSTAVSMTRQGLGITLLPKLATHPIPEDVTVAKLPFSISRPLGVSWCKNALLTPPAYVFLDVFKALYGSK